MIFFNSICMIQYICNLISIQSLIDQAYINLSLMKDKSQSKNNMKNREIAYNNNFNINQRKKDYDALNDKYASYYFAHKSVKKHLKQLKKAVDEQPNVIERKKLKTMISSKIKFKFPQMLKEKIDLYIDITGPTQASRVNVVSSQKKKLMNTFITRRTSRYSLHKKLSNRDQIKFPSLTHTNNSQEIDSKSKMNQQALASVQKALESQLIHKKNHRTFINFLQRKKQMIANRQNSAKDNGLHIKIQTNQSKIKDTSINTVLQNQQPNNQTAQKKQAKNTTEEMTNNLAIVQESKIQNLNNQAKILEQK